MSIIIKPYTAIYQQQVIDLILGIQVDEFGINITLADQPDLLKIEQIYQVNNGDFWLALDNDEVIGTIALLTIDEHNASIRKMFVNQAYRGSGVAQQLMETLLASAKSHQVQVIYLGTVSRLQSAIRFYEKHGFAHITKQQLPGTFPLVKVDDVFFQYLLK